MSKEVPKSRTEESSEESMTFACRWGSCSQMFATASELSSHLDLVDIPYNCGAGKWSCQWSNCSKTKWFKNRASLVSHVQNHTGEKKTHVCDMCPKTFNRREGLQSHRQRHCPGTKQFECRANEKCQKRFASFSERIKHEKTHKDVKYKCPSCDFTSFNETTIFKHHKQAHGRRLGKKLIRSILQPPQLTSKHPQTTISTVATVTTEVPQTAAKPEQKEYELLYFCF